VNKVGWHRILIENSTDLTQFIDMTVLAKFHCQSFTVRVSLSEFHCQSFTVRVSLSEFAGELVLRASEAPGFVGLGFVTSCKPVASDLFGARQPVSAGDSPENHLANSTETAISGQDLASSRPTLAKCQKFERFRSNLRAEIWPWFPASAVGSQILATCIKRSDSGNKDIGRAVLSVELTERTRPDEKDG